MRSVLLSWELESDMAKKASRSNQPEKTSNFLDIEIIKSFREAVNQKKEALVRMLPFCMGIGWLFSHFFVESKASHCIFLGLVKELVRFFWVCGCKCLVACLLLQECFVLGGWVFAV